MWLKQHGDLFLKKIAEFCSANENVSMDMSPVGVKSAEEKLVRNCIT